MDIKNRIKKATARVVELCGAKPSVGMILGSGLGNYADKLENPQIINYSQIPELPVSTVEGHAGRFVIGERFGKIVIAMQGRFHFYEGYTQQELTIPVRLMKNLGVETIIVTNAAGGVNESFGEGVLMLIDDHINYSGSNPLLGENHDDFGVRFPDMSDVYTKAYREKIKSICSEKDVAIREGVYMMFSGPNYETPAEVKMARVLGADAVGMSTVPEAIVAAHASMKVIGISCITNMAAGIGDSALNHEDVIKTSARVNDEFVKLIDIILEKVL